MNKLELGIQSLSIAHTDCLSRAIQVVNVGNAQIALVVDDNSRLIGTITDGDIRRALLRGESLSAPVDQIMFRNFRALSATATEEEALALMRREMLHQVPTLDEQGRVVGLFLLHDLIKPKKRLNPVVIMAGGEGKRLRPLTQNCPKPMLRVGGKPLLEIILEQCVDAGFQHFYLSVNYLKSQIKDYFGNGARWHVRIDYLEETQPLGTGGALGLLPDKPTEPILVLNADVLTRVNYSNLLRFHHENPAAATMCVREYTIQIPYGVVGVDNSHIMTLEEKPVLSHFVNAGIYLLDPAVLELVQHNQATDMPQLLEKVMQRNRVNAFPIHEYWLDVGHPSTFEKARVDWL